MKGERRMDPNTLLRDCKERPLNVHVAMPLHGRLDALLETLDDELGVRAFRRDLVAALILAAPEGADDLDELLRRYRRATVGEALIEGGDPDKILTFLQPRPGRRPAKARGA